MEKSRSWTSMGCCDTEGPCHSVTVWTPYNELSPVSQVSRKYLKANYHPSSVRAFSWMYKQDRLCLKTCCGSVCLGTVPHDFCFHASRSNVAMVWHWFTSPLALSIRTLSNTISIIRSSNCWIKVKHCQTLWYIPCLWVKISGDVAL